MAASRSRSLALIVVVVAALLAVWWSDRGRDDGPRRIEAPAVAGPGSTRAPAPALGPPAAPPIAPALAAVEVAWIADVDERALVVAIAAAIDRGGPFQHRQDGEVFADPERRLPARPPGYWREYTVAPPAARERGARRLVAGQRREIYYTRDHRRSFTALRGALP